MTRHRLALAALVSMSAWSAPASAQQNAFNTALAHLTSSVDTIRQNSLMELREAANAAHIVPCSRDASANVKRTVINALDDENGRINAPNASFPEAEGEFHAELIGCVASLHDARAAHSLAGALDTGMGASAGLLGLGGDVATPEIVAMIVDPKLRFDRRDAALSLAGNITAPNSKPVLSAANRASLRSALISVLHDRDPILRSGAVVALRSFLDADIRPSMLALAATDTGVFHVHGGQTEGAAPAANAWLRLYDESHEPPDADALFRATVASLADSIASIDRMVGSSGYGIHLRIDPRPLRAAVIAGDPMEEALADISGVVLDGLSARDRAARVATIQRLGFAVGDWKALNQCSPAAVAPPGATTWKPPEPCPFAPAAVAGVGIVNQTSRDAEVKIIIDAVEPYLLQFSVHYSFVRDTAWRLVKRSAWTIME